MTNVKYTNTATFIFPLLEIPKDIFSCGVNYPNGKLKYTTRFLNAYLKDENIVHYNDGEHVFLLLRGYRDIDFDLFYSLIMSYPNYIDDYEKDEFLVVILSVPDSTKEDYNLILEGKYSKISQNSKKLILGNFFYHLKPITIPLILNKSSSMKKLWEEKLNASIGDLDVWSKIRIEKETLTPQIMQNHTFRKLNNKISISNEL